MYNGIINVYKEKGFTSHDVVAKLRGILKQKKIGHTGTLDPDAEGVLPVCLGNATKVCDILTDKNKTYETELLLGVKTDTQDISGTVLSEQQVHITKEELFNAINSFIGEYNQIPPMYSALKVNGKKLYELAREGKEIERKARRVYITNINVISISDDLTHVKMIVNCSKGTYIRTLCHDIGQELGCGGCMKSLIRTKVGDFSLDIATKLETIQEIVNNGTINSLIISVDSLFPYYTKARVKEESLRFLLNGNKMKMDDFIFDIDILYIKHISEEKHTLDEIQRYRIYDTEGKFVAIYENSDLDNELKPVKMFL